jgi:hypothetical protein
MVDNDLYLETGGRNTVKARDLAANPRVAVHLDGINDALIVHGRAVDCRPDPALAASLASAFAAKYAGYTPGPKDWDEGGLHRIEPRVMLAWRDMPTATRWRFPTGAPDPKAEVIARIERDHAFWQALTAEIGEDRMSEPGPMGEWTFKDLASHLLGWRERTLDRLEAAAAGREEPPPPWPTDLADDDLINDWIQERNRDRPVRDVLDDVDRAYGRLAEAVAALPEQLVSAPDAFSWLGGEALAETDLFDHLHTEHMPSIRAWLDGRT